MNAKETNAVIDFTKELYLDGGMGSLLMERANMPIGYALEKLNITKPDIVKSVHNDYLASGSDVIYTNTFGLNRYKFDTDEIVQLISGGINIAKECATNYKAYVAFDIGPLGVLIGDGGITEDEAYDAFKEIITFAGDTTDCIVIETMTNLAEARIATLAALENSKLPIMVSMSFQEDGVSVFGNPIECFLEVISGLGAHALGINCTLGAKEMLPLVKKAVNYTDKPFFVKPNAGMPVWENGKTVYHTDAEQFSYYASQVKKYGVKIVGGCCGTTPDFIEKTKDKMSKFVATDTKYRKKSVICSAYKYLEIDSPKIIGERINPTGKKVFQQALRDENWAYILEQAVDQQESKADILDVNVGINGIDEPNVLATVIEKLQNVTTLPLVIDTTNILALEKALRRYNGKAIINSVNGTDESISKVLPLAKKYGAALIGLTIDESGIPQKIGDRVNVAKKIIDKCNEIGINNADIYIDTLTMAEASGKGNALCTLGTLKDIKKLGVKTVLGISNVSFGMPQRADINAKFMQLALNAGLDLCIINPNLIGMSGSKEAENFLLAKDNSCEKYIEYAMNIQEEVKTVNVGEKTLGHAVITGQRELAGEICTSLVNTMEPLCIVDKYLIPALDKVGDLYEKGKLFLPQLIASAEAAKTAFAILDKVIVKNPDEKQKVFIIATIKGDIHDIGKNIVKAVVANYGYKVVDLGKDVDFPIILNAVAKYYPCTLGLSALMTTTASNIEQAIQLVKEKFDIPILVGGAVLTKEYASKIGGIYCQDANDAVKKLKEIYI